MKRMISTAALKNDGGAERFDPGVFVNCLHCKQLTKISGSKRPALPLFISTAHHFHDLGKMTFLEPFFALILIVSTCVNDV